MLFHPWYPAMMLAVEASNVVDLRLWEIARGGTDAVVESRLMVKEKVDALFEAGSVGAKGGSSYRLQNSMNRMMGGGFFRD